MIKETNIPLFPNRAALLKVRGPHILYLGLHFKDLTFIIDGNPTFVTKERASPSPVAPSKSKIKYKKRPEEGGESPQLGSRYDDDSRVERNDIEPEEDDAVTGEDPSNNDGNNNDDNKNDDNTDENDENREENNEEDNEERDNNSTSQPITSSEESNVDDEKETPTTTSNKEEFINMTKFTSIAKIVMMIQKAVKEPFEADKKPEVQQLFSPSFFLSFLSYLSDLFFFFFSLQVVQPNPSFLVG